MKKVLLSLSLLCGISASAQLVNKTGMPTFMKTPLFVKTTIKSATGDEPLIGPVYRPNSSPTIQGAVSTTVVGNSTYDLQTNASTGTRIFVYPNGKISIVWTTTTDVDDQFPNRGSGYNYFDGTTWQAAVNSRIETSRTGWPSIVTFGNGSELVTAHIAATGGLKFTTNTGIGTTWTTSADKLKYTGGKPIWARAANNGDVLHVIQNFSDSAVAGDPPNVRINGLLLPMVYSRSTDKGATFVPAETHKLLPGYDSSRMTGGSADNYAMAASGTNVGIVVADNHGGDVALWKSTNQGQTFSKIYVDSMKFGKYTNWFEIEDTVQTNDGSTDVTFDDNGDAHVVFGLSYVYNVLDDTGGVSRRFIPGSAGIVYWNETTKTKKLIASVYDRNNNNRIDIEPATTYPLLSNKTAPLDTNGAAYKAVGRYGSLTLCTHPNVSVDAAGTIYVTYDAPMELDLFEDQVNYRDIYIVYSTDGGANWSDPQNLTQHLEREDVFASMAKTVDNFVHIVYQEDEIPGTNLQNNTTDESHPVIENRIRYMAIPVSEIKAGNIGGDPAIGNTSVKPNSQMIYAQELYPNPAVNATSSMLYLTGQSNVSYEIYTITGQRVASKDLGNLGTGNHEVSISLQGLAKGVYMVKFTTGSHNVTKKLVIE